VGCIAATRKNKIIRAVCIALMVLVPFSRMYVGVHTPADVLVGSAMALVMIFAFRPLLLGDKKRIPWFFGAMVVLSIAYLLYVELYPFPADLDAHNYESAVKNGYTFLGCFVGVFIVYVADEKKFHFRTDAIWWAQILKAVLGLAVVLAVKEGTRSILETICGGHMIARAIRYFLVVLTAGILWPLTFPWIAKLGRKK
jgi:undecaprenyl-diphosphatase